MTASRQRNSQAETRSNRGDNGGKRCRSHRLTSPEQPARALNGTYTNSDSIVFSPPPTALGTWLTPRRRSRDRVVGVVDSVGKDRDLRKPFFPEVPPAGGRLAERNVVYDHQQLDGGEPETEVDPRIFGLLWVWPARTESF